MKINEGCIAIDSRNGVEENLINYAKQLFRWAHEIPVHIATEPFIITTIFNGVKRRLSLAPGSAIICGKGVDIPFQHYHEVAEIAWVDTKILIPYTKTGLCSQRAKQLGINIDFDEKIGIAHICFEDSLDEENIRELAEGGVAETIKHDVSYRGNVKIVPKEALFFYLAKGFNIRIEYESADVRYTRFRIEPRLAIYLNELIMLGNGEPVLYGLGEGYITTFYEISDLGDMLYMLTLLCGYMRRSDDPKSMLYQARLSG
ncbi:MAG: hypothetical protein QXT53_06230 [Ignisphaera sp.]